MITRVQLADYLHDYLSCSKFNDYAPNGLQVEGKQTIKRICTAVTASEEVILQAADWQADALLVHHGYFWRGENPVIQGMKRVRIAHLLKHDINLFAYHLPLDCHITLGNNACLAKLFAVESIQMHKAGGTDNLLWSGLLASPQSAKTLANLLESVFVRPVIHIAGSNKKIQSIAWCSGAAQDFIVDAARLGVDAFISGEISERTYYEAKELGVDYFCCGHNATERHGIQALGEHLAEAFKLDYQFIDSENPV